MNDSKKNLLKDEINCQDGSVVSKQIVKKPNGNITLFAFDKDESLTEHSSPFEAVIYLLEGELKLKLVVYPIILKPVK